MEAQMMMIILMAMGLGANLIKHGETKNESKYNFWWKIVSIGITIWILHYGGFWDVMINR